MNRINPFFEVNGVRYELKKTRYLVAEYDKISNENDVSAEDKQNLIKISSLINDIQKYKSKVDELEAIFFETFDDDDERKYLKAKALYESKFAEFSKLETETKCTEMAQKKTIDILEKIAIKAISEQYFDMDIEKGTKVWCDYVDSVNNHNKVAEWLSAMSECLFKSDDEEEEDNSFLSQMKKRKQETQMTRKAFITAKK